MPTRPSSHSNDSRWQPTDHEARVLAGLLRHARLTVLLAEDPRRATDLLTDGLMPQLRRRATDRTQTSAPGAPVVVPFPDRRRARAEPSDSEARDGEAAVVFERWNEPPLLALVHQLRQAIGAPEVSQSAWSASLSDSLASLHKHYGLRLLVVLNAFDTCLTSAQQRSAAREFVDQFIDAVEREESATNFLIVLPTRAEHLLDSLRKRLPNIDEHTVRLASHGRSFQLASVSDDADGAKSDAAHEPAPVDDDAFRASLSGIVERTARAAQQDDAAAAGWQVGARSAGNTPDDDAAFLASLAGLSDKVNGRVAAAPVRENVDSVNDQGEAEGSALSAALTPTLSRPAGEGEEQALPETNVAEEAQATAEPVVEPPAEPPTESVSFVLSRPTGEGERSAFAAPKAPMWPWLAPLVLVATVWWLWPSGESPKPELTVRTAPPLAKAPASAAPPVPANPAPAVTPPTTISIDVSDSVNAKTLSALPAVAFEAPPNRTAFQAIGTLAVASPSPRFIVVSDDVLQAAKRAKAPVPLALVAPLAPQSIVFVVRANSPLNFVHDIRGARINAGAVGSARDASAFATYRALFGEPMPIAENTRSTEDEAIAELIAFRTLDVMVWSGSDASAWLNAMPANTRKQIKLLKIDPKDAASHRVLGRYGQANVGGAGVTAVSALTVPSFLVTRADADTAAGQMATALCASQPQLAAAAATASSAWGFAPAAQAAWLRCSTKK